ncbi:NTP transferase domain-containing protein [Candidatus Woesearchaeota archaeon]|jgi:choline kinase|nr:NTP transferase domain-containing protein [Candidatus Woesearchaeota archaeon]MBT5397240.1 NTP transferase domain-containing protein [Candidatus Woesearchaeota archaeon]MBT5924301.1 NTP transferase domain-containing protein [Candidatus Woesearchaeota archaeon]MBT6367214.1 NTP transferase domain-containing protein [Candidatus Woesearchaeota archaeon]MBT7762640.1 NTP transferase domain-containing protein [Candidatus Woesearchaeota archaeon]
MIQKAILLVAGLGNRLKPITDTIPKCLVEVNGTPILINTLNHLADEGIKDVVLVVGHLANVIQNTIGTSYKNMNITYIESKEYATTNNMYSLWLVRDHLEQGSLLIEGDSFFDKNVLTRIMNTNHTLSYWAGDRFSLFKEGCMLTTGDGHHVQKIQIVREPLTEYNDNYHKSVGILKITAEFGKQFSQWLDIEVQKGNTNVYYDLVIAEHINGSTPLFVCPVHGMKWFEIDDHNDLHKANELFTDKPIKQLETTSSKYEIVSINTIKPLEKVFPNHLNNLNNLLLKDGFVKAPLLVDKNTGIVLDGSHRYIFFLMHGYKTVPVQYVDYNNENIRVGTRLMHRHLIIDKTNISKSEVVERGLTGNIFSPRTTRHFFPFRKIDDMDLPLNKLEKGAPVDVQHYIEDVSVQEEIAHNEGFIQEIDQEIDEIINYMYEARSVKEYLKYQVDTMKK